MRSLIAVTLLTLACSREPQVVHPTDTREPIAVSYVSVPKLEVRSQPNATAEVIATYQLSEAVPVLVRQGEWTEIRVGDGSGWVRSSELGTGEEAKEQQDNPTVRFERPPDPVTNLTAKGDIYIEADVNTDGDVVNTRLLTNTTGSDALANANMASLRKAKFYPIIKNGERQPFKYYHRVTY